VAAFFQCVFIGSFEGSVFANIKREGERKMKVTKLAEQINGYMDAFKYFWAIGLIKETVALWRKKENKMLLNDLAQTAVCHYLNLNEND